jgi:hypothetical protein
MAANQKLTKLIKGRTISGTVQAENVFSITFTDGSKMTVKTAPSNTNSAVTGGVIDKVRQKGTELNLDLKGSGSVTITTAEATSSVMLRDKSGNLEYAD